MNGKLIRLLVKRKSFWLKVTGNSMLPILQPDDAVNFGKIKPGKILVNDICLIKKKDYLTHRIIYINKFHIISKGDSNSLSDGKSSVNNVIAKVIKIKRNGQIINIDDLYLFQSTLYFQEIVKIKIAFEKEKINFVFLKGLPLHLYFEGDHPRCLYSDCDVLIDKKDFEKAKKVLLEFYYKNVDNDLSPIQRKLKNKEIEASFLKIINGIPVVFDIHLEPVFMMTQIGDLEALYPQKLINQLTQEMLKNKKTIKINNEKFSILNSKFLIFYLSLHFFHHNFRGIFRLEFLDKVIRKSHLKKQGWIDIKTTINDYSLGNFVGPTFFLLKKYYSTPVPDSINLKNAINFKNFDIFSDETRLEAGINRFKYVFFLSPRPLITKILVFLNPQVIYLVFFTLKKKLSYFLSKH